MSETSPESGNVEMRYHLLLQERYQALGVITQANDGLDGKAMAILQVSGLISGIVGLLGIPQFITANPSLPNILLVILSLLLLARIVFLAMHAWYPKDYKILGTTDTRVGLKSCIDATDREAVKQLLVNANSNIDLINGINLAKAEKINESLKWLILEIVVLAIIVAIQFTT